MMGVWVLYDSEAERAVLYDSNGEKPIPGVAWIGPDAQDWAESFLAYLHTEDNAQQGHSVGVKNRRDPRYYTPRQLDLAQDVHAELVGDPGTGGLNDYGERLRDWLNAGPAHVASNDPYYKAVPEPLRPVTTEVATLTPLEPLRRGICVNHHCSQFEKPVPATPGDRCSGCEQLLCHESGLAWQDVTT